MSVLWVDNDTTQNRIIKPSEISRTSVTKNFETNSDRDSCSKWWSLT